MAMLCLEQKSSKGSMELKQQHGDDAIVEGDDAPPPLIQDENGEEGEVPDGAATALPPNAVTLAARLTHVPLSNSFVSTSLSSQLSPLCLVVHVNSSANTTSNTTATTSVAGKQQQPQQQVLFIKASDSPSSVHSERSRHHAHSRKVTRDIAALDFLQNIPMRSELVATKEQQQQAHTTDKKSSDQQASPSKNENDGNSNHSSVSDTVAHGTESLAGRRLPGFDATIVHVPPLFRYRFTTKYPAASAVVRRWEGMTAQQGLLGSRTYFSSGCGYPIATSTIIKYNGNETNALRKRFASVGSNLETMSYDWRGKSYFRLLHATWATCGKDRDSQEDHPVVQPYLPNYLDDPEFRQGRHRHVVRGDKNIGPIVSSILLFVKPNDLKDELNKKFQEKHAWLTGDRLSLSKIRNLKRETLTSCQRLDLEIATAAMACVYFEKLVLSHYVNKSNRKLYMSVCLLLAAKFNEPKASQSMKNAIKKILEEIDQVHSIPSREVLTAEFTVYAQLSFSLHVPLAEIQPHFTRLLKLIESNPRKYLDDDVFASYSMLVLDEKNRTAQLHLDAMRSFDGETQDEGTDLEALLSDEDEQLGVHGDDDLDDLDDEDGQDPSGFSWNRVSFAQWWRNRRVGSTSSAARRETRSSSMLASPIREEEETETSNRVASASVITSSSHDE
ncbi:Cyclin, partial [Globisporangium splendens]